LFADLCADLKINVYQLSDHELYLTKKVHTIKTEGVILVRGFEINNNYNDIIGRLIQVSESCDWIILVTTPLGVLNKGWLKLINDMKNLGAWVYIVDPFHSVIYGLLKGKKSPNKDKEKEEKTLKSLSTPIRAPDAKKKFSKYIFEEKYKEDNYVVFGRSPYPPKRTPLLFVEIDKKNLQYLLILHKRTGMSLDSLSWTKTPLDPDLVSGFISAIDSFGSSIKDSSILQEIKYKGFSISCAETNYTKGCLFLKEEPSQRLRELLLIGLHKWEHSLEKDLANFQGYLNPFIENHEKTEHFFNELFLEEPQLKNQ